MKVELNRINDNYLFEAKGASGVPVFIDNKTDEPSKGASPMELLLMSVGGCSAIDVVMILKKQRQEITSYKMEVEGQRKEVRDAKPFEAIPVTLYLEGKIDEAKAIRAALRSTSQFWEIDNTKQVFPSPFLDINIYGVPLRVGLSAAIPHANLNFNQKIKK